MRSKKQTLRSRNHLIETLRKTWTEKKEFSFIKDGYTVVCDLPTWALVLRCGDVIIGEYCGSMMRKINSKIDKEKHNERI